MKKPLLVDTDVFVEFLRGHPNAVAYVNAHADRIALSSIVAAELYAGARDEEELKQLDAFLALFPVLEISRDIARRAGLYKRDYQRSHGTGLADAIIAATAELSGAELKTFNVKHYPMLEGLKPPYVNRGTANR